jgi:hypothetical protein
MYTHTHTHTKSVCVELQSRGIPFASIFYQYVNLGERLTRHFRPAYIVRCLLQGDAIEPVCKLQARTRPGQPG